MNHTDYNSLEDMICVRPFNEGEEHLFVINSKTGPKKKLTFKKGEIITKEVSLKIDSTSNYEIKSFIIFYTGKNYCNQISILSDVKK